MNSPLLTYSENLVTPSKVRGFTVLGEDGIIASISSAKANLFMCLMFPNNRKAVCGIWCALMLCTYGQDTAPLTGDRLQADMAERFREFQKNNNTGGPRRPMSPEMDAVSNNPDLLDNLGAEDLAKMSLDDPMLKWAYVCVFRRSMGAFNELKLPQKLALADMRRRGESVSPMLLQLISENYETIIESSVLGQIGFLDTVRIEPFLEYSRRLLRERTQTMTAESAGVACALLGRYGTKDDEALLEWVMKERPYVTSDVRMGIKMLRDRLGPSPSELKEMPSPKIGSAGSSSKDAGKQPKDEEETLSWPKPWLLGGMILVVSLGLYRLLRKRQ